MNSIPKVFNLLSFVFVAFVAACRGGGGTGASSGSGGTGPLSDATTLACPRPGPLPFVLESTGFQNDANDPGPRSKDEAADTLGVPDGVRANTYLAAGEQLGTQPLPFRGRRASTSMNGGLSARALTGENVSLWFFDRGEERWDSLGRTVTDGQGYYEIDPAGFTAPLGEPVFAVLEADGSCAPHYEFLMPKGRKFIVTDIDGTMTLSDEELFKQVDDGTYDPKENQSAAQLMQRWAEKGYAIVYLTARPHNFRAETRAWLSLHDFPAGPVVSANSLVFDESARDYKSAWVKRMTEDYGWNVTAAYGNAESDIQAYEDGGIPKAITFIVGEFAGASGTQPINDNDFSSHLVEFVDAQPDAK